jgi:5-hydroxyisourate hydrolase-like protein (transthyretin family)
MRHPLQWFLVAAICVIFCGCSSGERARQKTYKVTGKVIVDGQPAADVQIHTHGKQPPDPNYPVIPIGITKEDGSFELFSYEEGDGVPAGQYTLTFIWQERSGLRWQGPDKLNKRYQDPNQTTHQLNVVDQPVDLGTITLTTQ